MNSRYDPGRQNVEYELRLECRAHIWQIEHSAAATATFAIPLQHAMSKYCRGSSLGHILHTDTHDTRPTAHILRTGACLPLCRGGMGEALWIRRGIFSARMACEITSITVIVYLRSAHERLYRGSDIRILKHCVFLTFYSYFCENVRRTGGQ